MEDSLQDLSSIPVSCKDDMQLNNELLIKKIEELENEKKKNQEEFGQQRAKMKDLFLQKEDELKKLTSEVKTLQCELDEARSQIIVTQLSSAEEKRKYEEEISSLQKLVNVQLNDENHNKHKYEIDNLRKINEKLATEIAELKSSSIELSASPLLTAPTTMFNNLAKKIQSGISTLPSADLLEEERRKAEEDTEVLRSLVVPLEDEIKLLKEMLRKTDDELRKYKGQDNVFDANSSCDLDLSENTDGVNTSSTIHSSSPSQSEISCGKIRHSQSSLKSSELSPSHRSLIEEERKEKLKQHQIKIEEIEKKYKDELEKETKFRKEMEEKWNEKNEEHKIQVADLTQKTSRVETELNNLKQCYHQTFDQVSKNWERLEQERKECQKHIKLVEKKNEELVGKHSKTASELQNEFIDLPNSIEELQVIVLQMRDSLIQAKVGKEDAESELYLNEHKVAEVSANFDSLQSEMNRIQTNDSQLKTDLDKFRTECDILNQSLSRCKAENSILSKQIENFQQEKETAEKNLRQQISSLQKSLKIQEKNQKDFVELNQSLQKELESTKSDNEVRWQHEEDIDNCYDCKNQFTSPDQKIHCRHCGKVFCANCCNFIVLSGPNKRCSKVCKTCHVILVKDVS